MDLKAFSTDVIGIDSTWDVKQVLVKDASTDNSRHDSSEYKQEQCTSTTESSEKEVRNLN